VNGRSLSRTPAMDRRTVGSGAYTSANVVMYGRCRCGHKLGVYGKDAPGIHTAGVIEPTLQLQLLQVQYFLKFIYSPACHAVDHQTQQCCTEKNAQLMLLY